LDEKADILAVVDHLGLARSMSTSRSQVLTIRPDPDHAGQRLDKVLAASATGLSRARLQALIRAGAVKIEGRTIGDPGHRVKSGDAFEIALPEPEPAEPKPQDIPLTVVYEDAAIIVIDKPAGLVVHPAAGHSDGTLVNALLAHCGASLSGIGGVRRPGIVHRLDKDTSGLLVVAKTDAAHQGLADQFEAHGRDGRLERRYLALVWGVPERASGRIDAPLARSDRNRTEMAIARRGGRAAATNWQVQERFDDASGRPVASLLSLVLETGRTHQIRVHLQHIGHPLMADPVYGASHKSSARRLSEEARLALEAMPGQALHAAGLGFEHPISGKKLVFDSTPPPAMAQLLESLRRDFPRGAPRPQVSAKVAKPERRIAGRRRV
jgi:23S rRNA pseudouridine1911/1915/1917 synthase